MIKETVCKAILAIALFAIGNQVSCSSVNEKNKMSNAYLNIAIQAVQQNNSIVIKIVNTSSDTVRLWKHNNSWGWSNWRILVVRNRLAYLIERNPDEEFTRNFPGYYELPPFSDRLDTLSINDGSWKLNNNGFQFKQGDEIIVLYVVSETVESRNNKVWTGNLTAYYAVK